ncbi:DUF6152 family protein [Sphingosinicella microcystinivorans]|uniref:Uncharacterized protein n=2 Tax=Sphingosinicella microcystinivorans TaxID=335406 RepID=A0AAD1G009_SPHMI|nr:DUF6152 family protein [Sphingosinicella microcystinivorans]BBE33402.1 hypothetical protein SmB9_10600 [Sphingosinicella microcystinivorans]
MHDGVVPTAHLQATDEDPEARQVEKSVPGVEAACRPIVADDNGMEMEMKFVSKVAVILSLGLAASAAPAIAHHSFAMFDQDTVVSLKGVKVVQFRWGNPHVFVVVESGNIRYALECSSPSAMNSLGWKHNSLKAGDTIDVTMFPLRSGKPGGALKTATLPNGTVLGDS